MGGGSFKNGGGGEVTTFALFIKTKKNVHINLL